MICKPKVRVAIVLSVFMGLVFSPVFAERYRTTEEIAEAEAIETPAEKDSLVDSTYNRAAGTLYIAGMSVKRTADAAGEAVVDTAGAGGKAVIGTAEAGGKTVERKAEAGGRALGDAADAVTGTAGAAYRTVMGGEEPIEEVEMEAVAIEQPKEKNLFEASWDALAGTAGAIGRTFEAAYLSVFPVKEAEEDEPDEPELEEPEERTHRFIPRHHGMVARRVAYRGR